MGVLNEANTVGVELERVLPKVKALFDRDDKFFSSIEKRPVEVISSRDMRIPLELRPGLNFGHWDPNGGDMGRGDGSVYDKAVISSVHFRGVCEQTTQSQWSTDNSRKAVLNTFRDQLAKGLREFKRNLDSACMTSGSGVLATSSAVTAAGGTGGGDLWTLNVAGEGFNARLLRFNLTVAIYDTTLATKRGEAKVNFYDGPNKIVHTLPAVAGVVAGDKLLISGLSGASPTSLFGVPYHHSNSSSGTWLGFSRSTTPEIRANRVNAAGSLALPFPRRAINAMGDRVGEDVMEGQSVVAWMHRCQKQAYEEIGQLISQIHKAPKEEGLDLYFNDNMQMAGAPVKTSYSWDKTRIDFINAEYWGRAELHGLDFYKDQEGKRVFPVMGASGGLAAAWLFYFVTSWNLFHTCPAAGSYIDGLTIPTGY